MEKKNPAEEQLREIATKANTLLKNIYALVTQAYISDTHYQEKVNALRNQEVMYDQLKLTKIQTANSIIKHQLLSMKLNRKIKYLNLWTRLKNPSSWIKSLKKKGSPTGASPTN